MLKFTFLFTVLPFILFAQKDIEGSKDHKYFPRTKGYYISSYYEFNGSTSRFINPDDNQAIVVRGKKTSITYTLQPELSKPQFKSKDKNVTWEFKIDTANYRILRSKTMAFRDGVNEESFYVTDYENDAKYSDTTKLAQTWVYIKKSWEKEAYREFTITIVDEDRVPNKREVISDLNTIGRVELYTVYFLTNQYKYEKESEPTINNIVTFLKDEKKMKIIIEGAADTVGSPSYNLELSKKRANYIKDALVSKGIDPKRLKVVGMGERMDRKDEDQILELQLNRRTSLIRN